MQVARKSRPQLYSLVTVSVALHSNLKIIRRSTEEALCNQSRPTFKPKNNKKGNRRSVVQPKTAKILLGYFYKFCDDCYSSRKQKSSAENESAALDDVPATVREQKHNR